MPDATEQLKPMGRPRWTYPNWAYVIRGLFAVFFCTMLIQTTSAETVEEAQHAAAEMVDDLSDCAAYYAFVKVCSGRENGEVAKRAEEGASQAFEITNKDIYLFGQMAKMSEPAMLAALKLAIDRIKEETSNGCQNLPVILVSRAKQCKSVVEKPQDAYFQKLAK